MDDLLGGGTVQRALPSFVAGVVKAPEQGPEVPMAVDGDLQHLALHSPVEALGEAVGLGRIGPCLAVLRLQLAAGRLEALGGEAGATVSENAGDLEGGRVDRRLEKAMALPDSSSSRTARYTQREARSTAT